MYYVVEMLKFICISCVAFETIFYIVDFIVLCRAVWLPWRFFTPWKLSEQDYKVINASKLQLFK